MMASSNSNVGEPSGPSQRNTEHVSAQATNRFACPTCQQDYHKPGKRHEPVITYCGHIFGKTCLHSWISDPLHHGCPTCGKDQFHACGHRCLPRPVACHAPVAPRAEHRRLHDECFSCHHTHAVVRVCNEDPGSRIAKERRTLGVRGLGYFLSALPELADPSLEATPERRAALNAFSEKYRRVLEECLERWSDNEGDLRW